MLWKTADADRAIACFRRAIEIQPELAESHFNLGNALRESAELDQAESCYRAALKSSPDFLGAQTNLAIALSDQGRMEEASQLFQRVHSLSPSDPRAHSHALVARHYLSPADPQLIIEAHRQWNDEHAAGVEAITGPRCLSRQSDRPLKLGLVSRDFRFHPVGFFLSGVLASIDSSKLEVTCYSGVTKHDDMTDRIRAASSSWREVSNLSDDQLARLINQDEIDILIDLAGHTAGHRLLVFARRPAPVQATWMGYVGTTGLDAIDFLISDSYHTPPGVDRFYTEELLRLPDGYVCYSPPDDSPPATRFPHASQLASCLEASTIRPKSPAKRSECGQLSFGDFPMRVYG